MKIHFVGVAGTGMSALAQLRAQGGDTVTGSDRLADRSALGETQKRLEAAGVLVFPQDGSGVDAMTGRVVVSTAIEADNADILRAKSLGLPIVHRADELAAIAASRRCVAVAGTSGKSTVTAMIFQLLETAGLSPSLACGANLPGLRRRGLLGNAWWGKSELLVIEADESDGTLTRYQPWLGLLLNISKDHKELSELTGLFRIFQERSKSFLVNADAGLSEFMKGALTFGFNAGAVRGEALELDADSCRFAVEGVAMQVSAPGRHNAENALAAVAAGKHLGLTLTQIAQGLAAFEGVGRRFESVGTARGVEVVDDFAHNPEKVRAVIAAARLRSRRILAIFQLHGFAPARFLKAEFLDAFSQSLGPEDALWLPDIYYVGGTAAKDISAADYARELCARGLRARHVPRRDLIVEQVSAEARPGDLVLVMGARDASLSDLASQLLRGLQA